MAQEEDGSLKIEMILGRRRLQPGQASGGNKSNKLPSPNSAAKKVRVAVPLSFRRDRGGRSEHGGLSWWSKQAPVVHHRVMGSGGRREREKYCYEYLVKYKGMSYLKTDWMTYHQIGTSTIRVRVGSSPQDPLTPSHLYGTVMHIGY